MKSIFGIVFGLAAAVLIICSTTALAAQKTGPLGVLNLVPSHLFFLTPTPHSPEPISKNKIYAAVAFDYFSVYSNAISSDHRIVMDMEAAVLDFRFAYGLTERLSLWIRVPLISMGDGFMDDTLEGFHKAFGLPNYGKETRPKDQFEYYIRKDSQLWFDPKKGGMNLTDSTFTAKLDLWNFEKKIPLRVGLTYEAKLPTGDTTHGLGSGAMDHGIFMPLKFSYSPVNVYIMPGYIHLGEPDFETVKLSVRDIKSLFIGGEYIFTPTLSFLAQINSYTSPFIDTGLVKLDSFSSELAIGVRYSFARQMSLELAFCEDLTRAAPDFNLHILFDFMSF